MLTLRKYQEEGNNQLSQAFLQYVAVCCTMPTGSGKTVAFSDIVLKAIRKGTRVLILCNRIELISQAHAKLKANGLRPTLIIPGYRDTESQLYLGSVDTIRNYKIPDVGLAIFDEAHLRDFDEIVLELKLRGVYCAGFTATPIRYGKRLLNPDSYLATRYPHYTGQLGDVYDHLIQPVTITELLEGCSEGYTYLVPCITYAAQVDVSKFKTVKTKDGEDYSEADQLKYFNTPKLYGGTVDKYLKHAAGTKAICYCVNVMASQKQAQEFNARGIPAIHIDGSGKMKSQRAKIFKDFEDGVYTVLCNVAVATTGNDIPKVETIIMNRITKSLSLYLQIAGRGARMCPEIGKAYFNYIDMGGNVYRHGFWHQEREWSLDVEVMSWTKGVAPVRECEKCEALIPASANTCFVCNAIQVKKKEEAEKRESEAALEQTEFGVVEGKAIPAVLRIPFHEMSIEQLEMYRDLKGHTIAWVVRQLHPRGESALYNYAALKNYSRSWVPKQMNILQNNKEKIKNIIWEFMQANLHLTNEYLIKYAEKQLKSSYDKEEIASMIPRIIGAYADLKAMAVKVQ